MVDLIKKKFLVTQAQSVHSGTLRAFVKEQLEKLDRLEDVPKLPDVLVVNPIRNTIIK